MKNRTHHLNLSKKILEGCREQSTIAAFRKKVPVVKTLWGGAILGSGEKLTCGMSKDYLSVWEIGDMKEAAPPPPKKVFFSRPGTSHALLRLAKLCSYAPHWSLEQPEETTLSYLKAKCQ